MKKPLIILFISLLFVQSNAQTLPQVNHANDSLHLTEQILLQQQQQTRIDSIIRARLQQEIDILGEESQKKKELERQLREIAFSDSIRKAEQSIKIELLRRSAIGFPVILLKDTLFNIYTRSGSFNPAERANAISGRINKLYEDDFFNPDSIKVLRGENTYDIVYNELIIISVLEIDALYFNKNPETLAKEYEQIIRKAIIDQKQANSLFNWLKRIGLVAIVIIGIYFIIFLINRLFKFFFKQLVKYKDRYFTGISIKNFTLFTPKQHLKFFVRTLSVMRIITILLMLYLSLPILFSIFPQTKSYTYTLLNWIISPIKTIISGIINYLPNLITILVIYFFTRYVVRGVKYIATEAETGNLKIKGFYSDWAHPTYNIIKFLLYAFMLVVIFPYLPGSDSPAFRGVSVFLGILFSIGSSSAVANMVAGLVITYMRPFRVGDRVKIGEVVGDVVDKTLLVTRIRTIKNEDITVPNASVLSGHTVNYSSGAQHNGLIIHSTVTIGYDVPWKKVHEALINAASRTEMLLNAPAPFVLQTSLDDFYVSYQLNAYTKNPSDQARIYSELHQHIQDSFNEAGIEIMSPHYRAMRDGNMTTIPEDYLPKDYSSPSFSVSQVTPKNTSKA